MKRFALLLMVCLVFVMVGTAFATTGPITPSAGQSAKVTLNANVGNFASITAGTPSTLSFTGDPKETKRGSVDFTIESNCDINTELIATKFANGADTLKTEIQDQLGVFHEITGGSLTLNDSYLYLPNGTRTVTVNFQATTGLNISSQAAGDYKADLTMTVYSL